MEKKSLHYWELHRRVALREWASLQFYNPRAASIIAADVEHSTPEFKTFESKINSETERLYANPANYFNFEDPHIFRYKYAV